MDRIPINEGYFCGRCDRWISMAAFDGVNENARAVCYLCRGEKGRDDFAKHLARLSDAMGMAGLFQPKGKHAKGKAFKGKNRDKKRKNIRLIRRESRRRNRRR